MADGSARARRAAAMLALATTMTACGGRSAPAPPAPPAPVAAASAAARPGTGVSQEPCPHGHPDRGCIYLGTVSDLEDGPLAETGRAMAAAQQAFWRRVNDAGGVGGHDVDVVTHAGDSGYEAQGHRRAFDAVRNRVLALAQTLGVPHTAAIQADLREDAIVAVPASGSSAWEFADEIAESGASPCIEAANAVDHVAEEDGPPGVVLAVHYPGGYGEDAAAGARAAARRLGARFVDVVTPSGHGRQGPAVEAITAERPALVVIATGPAELAVIVSEMAARGFAGRLVGVSPAWDEELLGIHAADFLRERYLQALPWAPWGSDTAGHRAMRAALTGERPSEAAVAGWVSQYPLRAALERAADAGPLTRRALLGALRALEEVDAEGMLPGAAGNFAAAPPHAAFRQTVMASIDPAAPTGLALRGGFFAGPTAAGMPFDRPCH
jgi:ABC-type branched-subunit amino acid transport system substrate-binding protein